MTFPRLLCAAIACTLVCATATIAQEHAQDQGYWRAESSNAKSITGDIAFSPYKITIDFSTFTLAQIRTLKPGEARTLFNPDDPSAGAGNLYRLSIPSTKHFLHHRSLCGGQDADWVITFVSGRNLQIAIFSDPSIPTLTPDALANTTRVCGIFTYKR